MYNIYEIYNKVLTNVSYFGDIGFVLTFLGCSGVLANKHNIIRSIIAIELMFYGLNFYLVTTSLYLNDIAGEIFGLFVLTLAAAESAIALALMVSYFKIFKNILIQNN